MPKKMPDIINKTFFRLTAIAILSEYKNYKVSCVCSCGNKTEVWGYNLVSGHTRSCGCLDKETMEKGKNFKHGYSHTNEYNSWVDMRKRCYTETYKDFKNWGGRGIKVEATWLGKQGFQNFIKDMGNCPKGFTLERINNDKNYGPTNCRWASRLEQGNNKRTNRCIEFKGMCKTFAQWSRYTSIPYYTLQYRFSHNWDVERALTTPANRRLSL